MKFKVQIEMKSTYIFDIKAVDANEAIHKAQEEISEDAIPNERKIKMLAVIQ